MKLVLIAGIGLLAVAQARAASPFDSLAVGRSAPVVGCADFSGNWKGTCQVEGVTSPDEQTALQDGCRALQVKNLYVPLGGSYSLIATFAPKEDGAVPYVNNSSTSQWDSSRQVIQFNETVNNRNIGGLSGDKPTILTGEMKKVDGKLLLEVSNGGKTVIACEYEKQ